MKAKVTGCDLKAGQVVETWAGLQMITGFRPYGGPLVSLFTDGARIAEFAALGEMTIDHADEYTVVAL